MKKLKWPLVTRKRYDQEMTSLEQYLLKVYYKTVADCRAQARSTCDQIIRNSLDGMSISPQRAHAGLVHLPSYIKPLGAKPNLAEGKTYGSSSTR